MMGWKATGVALIVLLVLYGMGVQVVSSQGLFIRAQYLPGDLPFEPKSPPLGKIDSHRAAAQRPSHHTAHPPRSHH